MKARQLQPEHHLSRRFWHAQSLSPGLLISQLFQLLVVVTHGRLIVRAEYEFCALGVR